MLALQLVMLGAAFMTPPRVASGPHATLIGRYAVTRTAALVMETTEVAAAADPYNKSEALQMPTTFESYQERAAAGVVAAAALSTLGMDALLAVDGSLGLMSLALATGVVAANANNDTAVGRGLLALGDAVSNVLDNTIGNAKKTREGIERERMARIDQLKQEGSQVIASRKALQSAFEDEIASRMAQQSAVLKRASAVAMAAASPVDDELPLAEAASSAAPAAAAPAPAAPAAAAPASAAAAAPAPAAPAAPAAAAAAAPGAIEEDLERVRVACRGFEGHWAALVESRRVVLELESQAAAAAAQCEAAASALSVLERQQAAESVAAQAAASEKADAARAAAEAAAAEKAAAEKAAATERAAKETVNKCARQEQLLAEAEAQATSTLSALRAAQAELAALLARAGDELLGGTAAPAPSLTVPTMSPVVQRAPEAAPEATPVPEAPVPPPLAAMASPPLASPPAMARQADILPSRMPVAPSTPSTPALARAPAFTFMPGAPSSQLPPPPRSESPPTAANVPKPNVNRAVPRPEVVTASIAPKPNVNFGAAAPTRAPVTADTVPRPKSNAPPRSEADKAVSSASLNVAEVMSDTSLPKASANRDDSSQCVWAAVKLRDGVSDTKFPPARLLSEFPEALSVECIFDDRGRCRSQCLVFPAAMKSKQLQSSVLGCWVKPLKQPMEPNAREGYNWVSYTREQLIARSGHEVAW
jgi:hypothetical protein